MRTALSCPDRGEERAALTAVLTALAGLLVLAAGAVRAPLDGIARWLR